MVLKVSQGQVKITWYVIFVLISWQRKQRSQNHSVHCNPPVNKVRVSIPSLIYLGDRILNRNENIVTIKSAVSWMSP